MDKSRQLRVLHVVGRMVRGGVETWLMHILNTMDREKIQNDILVHLRQLGEYDEEITTLGAKILVCPIDGNPFLYAARLARVLHSGAYDVVHSHVHHFSGWVLLISRLLGIPVRIAHSHSDTTGIDAAAPFGRRLYLRLMKWLIDRFATVGLAVSAKAAQALKRSESCRLKWHVIPCGIDLAPFALPSDKALRRRELSLPDKAMIVVHVGNFTAAKNHPFILQIFGEIDKIKPDSYLLLVGDGGTRHEIEAIAKSMPVADRIIFLGRRPDVPAILASADVFLFPSAFEGLPLAVIEAQAAGLPVVIASTVSAEIEAVPGLLWWLSLSQPPTLWAQSCLQAYDERKSYSKDECLRHLSGTLFNILSNTLTIEAIYRRQAIPSPTSSAGSHSGS
jgi:glycosyltransferase involved in cell wall biosynthesis